MNKLIENGIEHLFNDITHYLLNIQSLEYAQRKRDELVELKDYGELYSDISAAIPEFENNIKVELYHIQHKFALLIEDVRKKEEEKIKLITKTDSETYKKAIANIQKTGKLQKAFVEIKNKMFEEEETENVLKI